MNSTKDSIKEFMDGIRQLFEFIDTTGLAPQKNGLQKTAIEMFDSDVIAFLMYLMASDGRITEREADYLSERFEKNYTPSEIADKIITLNIYSEEFELTVPDCMKTVIELDNEMSEKAGAGSESLISLYRLLGDELIQNYAGNTEEEEKNCASYIKMLERYRERHLEVHGIEETAVLIGEKKKIEQPTVAYKRSDETTLQHYDYSNSQASYPNRKKCCPYCHSENLTTKKKGFGVGKAALGVLAVGPIGALAGGHNANQLVFVCLNCGQEFEIHEAR